MLKNYIQYNIFVRSTKNRKYALRLHANMLFFKSSDSHG